MVAPLDRALRPVLERLPALITPNAITVFRGLLVVPILVLHRDHPLVAGFGIFLPAMVLDAFDGPLARHRGEVSESGAFLDATVDKLFLHGLLWLALVPAVPVPLAAALTGVDLLLTAIRAAKRRRGLTMRSNVFGKAKTIIMSFGVGFALTQVSWLIVPEMLLLGVAALFAGASLIGQLGDLLRKQDAS